MKILFVCSTGGISVSSYKLRPWWEAHERRWVTFDDPHSRSLLRGERVTPAFAPTTRKRAQRHQEPAPGYSDSPRPIVPMSSSPTAPGWRFRSSWSLGSSASGLRIWKVFDRITRPTMTGRLCYPIAELSCSSGRSRCGIIRAARVIGCLL